MEWLNYIKDAIKGNPHLAVAVPAVMSSISFVTNLLTALSDGVIDDTELHQLMSSANGIEMLVLFLIMIALRDKKK